ncbi:MAG: squalene/phytoene synthase family protein, partial [Sedimenticolaceae bacterium]
MPNLAFPNAATPIGSIPYYAIRFSSAEQRNGLAARYSWLHEIDRIISTIKDPGVARLKLDWWHKEWTQA